MTSKLAGRPKPSGKASPKVARRGRKVASPRRRPMFFSSGDKPLKHITDEQFSADFQRLGLAGCAKEYGVSQQGITARRQRVEKALGISLLSPNNRFDTMRPEDPHLVLEIKDGVVLVGSDAHYWPGVESTAHRAFVCFAGEMKPKYVIFNGDALDAPTISRHSPIGWENLPTLEDELAEVQTRLGEIQAASGKKCRLVWPLGNHDARFNTRLASLTPQYRNVPGTRLVHHFPDWEPCWSCEIGGEKGAVVKHRFKGGMHAPYNNAVQSGRTMVTGHLHSQKVIPFTDYNGTRWGVDTGCLAAVGGPQFTYQENNPANWRAGFAVLTWKKGVLMPPELVTVVDEKAGLVTWRGENYSV